MSVKYSNDNIILYFDENDIGYTMFKLPKEWWYSGYLKPTTYNNIGSGYYWEVSTADYYILLIDGVEYSVADLTWTTYLDTEKSINLYGKFDTINSDTVSVVKSVSEEIVYLTEGRYITKQEVIYYFSVDGEYLLKKVKVWLNESVLGNWTNVKVLQFTGYNSFGPRVGQNKYFFGKTWLGFDYESVAEFLTEWVADGGLTISVGRGSSCPNLLPGFTSSEWRNPGSVASDSEMTLKNGDFTEISVFNAFPDDRDHYLFFDVSGLTGVLQVGFSLERNVANTLTSDNFQFLEISADGPQVLAVPAGFGKTWLYVSFKAIDGGCTISVPVVSYRGSYDSYIAPDGSDLSNVNLRNCIKVESANPSGKYLTKILTTPLQIERGKGIGISILSKDRTHITDGAFLVECQKADGTWVASDTLNMFVDWNEKYDLSAEQFNLWDDSIFGVPVPAGVNTVYGIRLKFLTSSAIEWILTDFFVLTWNLSEFEIGTDVRRNFGPSVEGIRARDFCMSGVSGAVTETDRDISMEKVPVVPGGISYLSFGIVTDIYSVKFILDNSIIYKFSDFSSVGWKASISLASLGVVLYPTKVENLTSGETITIIGWDSTTEVLEIDIASKSQVADDVLKVTYTYAYVVDPLFYSLNGTYPNRYISWDSLIDSLVALFGDVAYIDYEVGVNEINPVGLSLIGASAETNTVRFLNPDIRTSSNLCSVYSSGVLSDEANSYAETTFAIVPTKNNPNTQAFFTFIEEKEQQLNKLLQQSRPKSITPTPINYNLIPHVAFGGEQIAAEPIQYLKEAKEKLSIAGTANAIVSAGALSFLRDRDISSGFWYWGGPLLDSGVDYLHSTRQMIRSDATEEQIKNNISKYRYLFEVTTFAYEHNKRYPSHASVDYKGDQKFKRVWYYQESGGLYTSVTRSWDDFEDSYYEPIILNGKSYTFQYHYTLIIPAFWSIVEPKTKFGLTEDTVYDLMAKRIEHLSNTYDCDGIIISELFHYREGFSDNDFILYNEWCVANGYGTQEDWPRFHENNYADPDDKKVWGWKCYQVKKFLTEMARIAHSHEKLLGVNVLAQNIFSITNVNSPSWEGVQQKYNPEYHSWHVNTLQDSLDRYGTNYAELLSEDVVDLFYVWLYYPYSPFGQQAVLDFISEFEQYKERMLITIGLFPKENPPKECEIVALIRILLSAGWNVAYAGYPPMLIQDENWSGVWGKIADYVPSAEVNSDGVVVVDPAYAVNIPFYTRF